MDANRKITIDGREWPVNRPTDGQLIGLAMISKGELSQERTGSLLIKLILQLLPEEESREAFIGEFLTGNYGPEHLQILSRQLMSSTDDTAEPGDTELVPKPRARKKPAAKTTPGRRRQ